MDMLLALLFTWLIIILTKCMELHFCSWELRWGLNGVCNLSDQSSL